MHKKIAKAITGSLLAATMAATTAVQFVAPMSASAGSVVGQSDFNDGIGLPWHTCVTQPAHLTFSITNGAYKVTIDNNGGIDVGGDSRWDCQFRHRNLHIEAGHSYKISFDINSTANGELATHVATLDGTSQVAWLSGHGGTQAWSCNQTGLASCPNGHSSNSGNLVIKKGDNHFESTFTATETIEVAEWAFHFGGAGEWQNNDCFPEGTTLTFDNMVLECTSCGDTYKTDGSTPCLWDPSNELGVVNPRSDVRLNQTGYFTNLKKVASYATDSPLSGGVTFWVKDASGNIVYTGTGEPITGKDTDSGEYIQILDFTDADIPEGADYYIEVDDSSNVWTNEKTGITYDMYISHPFNVNNNVYDGMLTNAMNYYYQNRSGIAIEPQYITSGDKTTLSHQAGHTSDKAYVQSKWVKSYSGVFDGDTTYQIDCTGGWYDAGDHGKYVVNGGISVWTLQNMYEMSLKTETDDKWTNGTMVIPESGDSVPDVLDEARYELEWMIDKMVVKSSDPYWGKYAGMVYHKMHDHKWTGLAVKAWDYESDWETTRIVKPPSFAASLNLAAAAAQAARLWKGIDDSFADKCLSAAETAYEAVKTNYYAYTDAEKNNPTSLYAPLDQAIGGGAYGDNYVDDDMYWAACELYATTGEQKYYNDLSGYSNPNDDTGMDKAFSLTTNLGGGENSGSFSSFNWGCTAGLGTLSLYLNQDNLSATDVAKIEKAIVDTADKYIAKEESQGMGIPYQSTTFQDAINIGEGIDVYGYEWGSNSFVINNAIVMAYAYEIEGTNKYISGVSTAMDYILGRNANGISYVTGYGEYAYSRPHHRYWSYELDHSFPMAPAGVMSGGPGQGLQDPYVAGLGYDRNTAAPQKCYVDSIEAWSVNEVTINWNAPFAWVVSFLEDEAPDAPAPDENPTDVLYGDANDNGTVEIADAVFILQAIADPSNAEYKRTARGEINADCSKVGNGVDAEDALAIQQFKADIVTKLPV